MSKKTRTTTPLDLAILLNAMPDLYLVLNSDFEIEAVSKSYAAATNIHPEKVISRNIFDVFPVNPEDPNATGAINLRASLERVLKNKTPDTMAVQKYDIPNEQNTGFEERFWSPVNTPILSENHEVEYIIHRVEDVTAFVQFKEKKSTPKSPYVEQTEFEIFRRAQEIQNVNMRLRESEELLRLFIDSIKDYAFIILDAEGYIFNWNPGAERIKGYKLNEIIGKNFAVFYTEEEIENHRPQFELRMAKIKGRYETEGWRVRKDGSEFLAHVIITPLYDAKKHLIGYGQVTRDLTESKMVEQLKNEFVSIVSHELRTPLTSIHGAISSAKIQELLTIANTNCGRLIRLINDILDVEKIENNKTQFHFQVCNLGNVLLDAVSMNKLYTEKFNVKVICSTLDNVLVNTDTNRLTQVLTNLISNAVKFSKHDSVVTMSMSLENARVRISVQDNGPGIPEEFKDKIFQKFSQADMSSYRSEPGTGLGLAISKAIIRKLGGELQFESTLGEGTTFYFDLPKWDK
jgi:two-component system sensor histidine kinase EvgS